MVIKILSGGGSSRSALEYNDRKVAEKVAERIGIVNIRNTIIPSREILLVERSRMIAEQTRNKCLHMAINPAEGEEMDDDKAVALVKDILSELGVGTHPYIIYKHHDIERVHYHVVCSRINPETFRAAHITLEYQKVNEIMKALSSKYGYAAGKAFGGIRNPTNKAFSRKEGNATQQIRDIVETVRKQYKYRSLYEFTKIMRAYKVEVEELSDTGRLAFSGLSSKKKCTPLMLENELFDTRGKKTVRKAIEDEAKNNQDNSNEEVIRQARLQLEEELYQAYRKAESKRHIIALMKKKGYTILAEEKAATYQKKSITEKMEFVDHNTGMVFNIQELHDTMTLAHFDSLPETSEQNERQKQHNLPKVNHG